MPIRGAEYAVSRIIATLQAYLPAERDLIDIEMSDGLTLADVDNAAFYDYENDATLVEQVRSIVVIAEGTDPLAIDTTTNSPGRAHEEHTIIVTYNLKDVDNETPNLTRQRVHREARAIERVLAIKYPTLPNLGAETVVRTYREGTMTYRLTPESGEGQNVRSAVIPFKVVTHEQL